MAKLFGGITGRPSGRVGNVIYGAARTRRGKSATARATFSPSNPNTPAQQAQRARMRTLSQTAKRWNPTRGRAQWNTIEGNLPVYQSILRLLFQASDEIGDLGIPRPISLGPTPRLQNLRRGESFGAGRIVLLWDIDAEPGPSDTDEIQMFITPGIASERTEERSQYIGKAAIREATELELSGLGDNIPYLCAIWVSPADAADPNTGNFPAGSGSEVQWIIADTGPDSD